jgi:hypothetical protein
MKVTATRDVFTLNELDPAARDKAIEHLRNDAWECLDSDMVSEDLAGWFAHIANGNDNGVMSVKQLADKYGIRIYWSVAYVQGDNASISGYLDRATSPNLAWRDGITGIRVTSSNRGWSHVEDVYVGENQNYATDETQWEAARKLVEDLCGKLYRQARELCEAYTSEDYVLDMYENCYGNRRRFTATGDYAPHSFWTDEVPA